MKTHRLTLVTILLAAALAWAQQGPREGARGDRKSVV